MKKIYIVPFFLFVLYGSLFSAIDTHAQTWKWGIANDSFGGVVEASPTVADRTGNVFVAGIFFGAPSITIGPYTVPGSGGSPLFVVKADSTGHVLWVTATQLADCSSIAIATDPAGNAYVTGQYTGSLLTFGAVTLHNDSLFIMNFIAKLSPGGTVLWAHNISGNAGSARFIGGVGVDGANNVYVAGSFNRHTTTIGATTLINTSTVADSDDVFIVKYDSSGNVLWAKSFGGHGNDYAKCMSVTNAGNLYIDGWFTSPTMVVGSDTLTDSLAPAEGTFISKFDSSGHPVWAKAISTHLKVYDLKTDAAENNYRTGDLDAPVVLGTDTLAGPGAFILKYDSSGNLIWANSAISTGAFNASGSGIAVDTCGNSWIAGEPRGILNFNGHLVDTPAISTDPMFIAAYDHCGKYIVGSGLQLTSGGDDAMGIALDNMGNLYVGGDYEHTSLIFGLDTLPNTGPFGEFLLIAKYHYGPMPCSHAVCHCTDTGSATFTKTSEGFTRYFNYTGSTAVDSLRWFFGDGSTSNTSSPIHNYTDIGLFHACLVIYTPCRSDTTCDTVLVPERVANIPNSHSIALYPNPATTSLTITSTDKITTVSISNLLGQIVYTHAYNSEKVHVDVADLPSGVYFVKVNGSEVSKFVKE